MIATAPPPTALADDVPTTVSLTWIERKIEHWIAFGRHSGEQIEDRAHRSLQFNPGAIFGFVRWASNDFGTVISEITVIRAVTSGEPYVSIPFVRPGGGVLLKVHGWPKVQRVLAMIDSVDVLLAGGRGTGQRAAPWRGSTDGDRCKRPCCRRAHRGVNPLRHSARMDRWRLAGGKRWHADAVSAKDASGLKQLMPPTWQQLRAALHLGSNAFDPHDNILAGAAYAIDYRRTMATYYLPSGESVELPTHNIECAVAAVFDAASPQVAIREAQQQVPGYTSKGFCQKAAEAGCAYYYCFFPRAARSVHGPHG